MGLYLDLETRKKTVREYIRKNSSATFRDIKRDLHIKINKLYLGGMQEAYIDAGVAKPRTLNRKTIEEKKKIIINYIRKNPLAGGQIIRKETKINFLSFFNNTKEAFDAAGINYPREKFRKLRNRGFDEKKNLIIKLVRENPLIKVDELAAKVKTHPYSLFKDIKEIYSIAEVIYPGKGMKTRMEKRRNIIGLIKRNNFVTQREINRICKTKVQNLFEGGIFGAYKEAKVQFPFERLQLHGAAIMSNKKEANDLEIFVFEKLMGYGRVNRLVKTKRGFADIILERKENKAVIEVKNYRSHEISISQINQLNGYLEDIDSNLGFLVCLKKPKKDIFLMGKNKIFVLTISELGKIPLIMDL